MPLTEYTPDPRLDLLLERVVDVPREMVWNAWTQPEQIVKWFTPAPWSTVKCEIDLHPGGKFRTVMRSPEGQEFDNTGCFLQVIENERLIWTGAMEPGFRPKEKGDAPFLFTAVITFEEHKNGTKYSALAMHSDEEGRKQHEGMGFHGGWSTALDQLVAMVKAESA